MIKFMLQLTAALVAAYVIGFTGIITLPDTPVTTMIPIFLILITSAYISLLAQATLKIMNHRNKIKYNNEEDAYSTQAARRMESYLKSRQSYIGDDGEIIFSDTNSSEQSSQQE